MALENIVSLPWDWVNCEIAFCLIHHFILRNIQIFSEYVLVLVPMYKQEKLQKLFHTNNILGITAYKQSYLNTRYLVGGICACFAFNTAPGSHFSWKLIFSFSQNVIGPLRNKSL